jgi:hypothetical protein
MFGWFKKRSENKADTVSDERVQELVSAYGALLEDRSAATKPITLLPAAKGEMDTALLRAIELTPQGDMRQHLRNAFLWLADYQPMTSEEAAKCQLTNAALNQPGDGSVEDAKGRALALDHTKETHDRFAKAALEEMTVRAQELERRFGQK